VIVGDDAARGVYHRNIEAAKARPRRRGRIARGYFTAKGAGPRAANDIVQQVAAGSASVDSVDSPQICPRRCARWARRRLKQELDKRVEERNAAEKELSTLARQRDEYLKNQAADGKDGGGGFDAQVNRRSTEQLKR